MSIFLAQVYGVAVLQLSEEHSEQKVFFFVVWSLVQSENFQTDERVEKKNSPLTQSQAKTSDWRCIWVLHRPRKGFTRDFV